MKSLNLRRFERGQALPLLALCMVVLCGFVALAVDAGAAQFRQRAQQTATDAAAIAGATELEYSTVSSDVTTAAQGDATTNGFSNDANDTVTVNYPPATGNYAGSTGAVQVVIASTRSSFFGRVLGQGSGTVSTTATAILTSGGAAPCVYQLDPSGSFVENSGTLYAPTCGIIANGSSTYNNGTITASTVGYAGTISVNSTTFVMARPAPSIPSSAPSAQIPGWAYPTDKPPSTTPCLYNNLKLNAQTVTLSPGVYCGGLTANSSTITFNPGLYVMTGDMKISGNGTTSGTGVTFDITSGGVTLNGNSSTTTLSAPTTGNYANVLFFQPKANTNGPTLNSGKTGALIGALYFPGGTITGNSSGDAWTLIIGASITLNAAVLKGPNGKGMTGGVANVTLAE